MVFESGSRVARQSAPHYRQCDLTTGIETQSESQPFPAELLASPHLARVLEPSHHVKLSRRDLQNTR